MLPNPPNPKPLTRRWHLRSQRDFLDANFTSCAYEGRGCVSLAEFEKEAYNIGRIPGHYVPLGLTSFGGVDAIRFVVDDDQEE